MGCCISCSKKCNNKAQSPAPAPSKHQHLLDRSLVPESDTKHNDGKAFEEETVKEVLSETPNPRPAFPKPEEEALQKPLKKLPSFPKIEEEEDKNASSVKSPFEDAISEDSDLYSFSESVSTSAATEMTREDDGEVTQRTRSPVIPRKRSVPGQFAGRGERGGKSPARRSPARKNDNSGTSFHGREVGQTAARRRILAQNGPRRDSGESSSRRTRSPVTRTDSGIKGVCRSPSSRRVPVNPENGRMPASTSERRWMVGEGRDGNWATKESLEDPLVSLECFIFL